MGTRNCPHDPTAKDFDPTTCQNLYTMIGQSDCIVRAFRSPASSQDPCSTVQLPFGDYDNETLDVLETMVACENFSYAHGLCVDEFSKLNPTEASDGLAVRCILEAAKRPEFAGNRDAQTCLKFGGGNDGLLQSAAVKVGCTSWCCPGLCPGGSGCSIGPNLPGCSRVVSRPA